MKFLRLGVLALLLGGCDGAKALYDAVAATGDHTKAPIPLAVLMSAAPQASGSPGASTGPSFFPTAAPTATARPTPAPASSATPEPTPSPTPTATPGPATYEGPYFKLAWDPQLWSLTEASVEQSLMGDAAYLVARDAEGVRMAIVDDPRAKDFERLRGKAEDRMARLSFSRDASLSGQDAWEVYGLVGASARTTDEKDDDKADEDEVAAPNELDAALGKVTYYLSSSRDGRTYGLRLEMDGKTPLSAADARVELARRVAISWRWKY